MNAQYKITRTKFNISIKKNELLQKLSDDEPDIYEWNTIGMTRGAEKHAGKLASEMTDDELIADFVSHPHDYGAMTA